MQTLKNYRFTTILKYTVKLVAILVLLAIVQLQYFSVPTSAGTTAWTPPAGSLSGVSTGANHSCAVASSAAYCWGQNTNGQIGNGSTTTPQYVPTAVTATAGVLGGKTVTSVSAGTSHTCAVASGVAYCWGRNTNGQLGNNSTAQSTVPVAVTAAAGILGGKTVTSISAGASHTCAVASGVAYCWGLNTNGQLGNNSTAQSTVPVAVTVASGLLAGKTVTSIGATSSSHSCATASDVAYCWGLNSSGQLGNNSTTQSTVPVAVSATGVLSGKTMTRVGLGATHSCAIGSGAAYCWGAGANGRLGNNAATQSNIPVTVTATGVLSGQTIVELTGGTAHTCALSSTTNRTYCWGLGSSGQLGNAATGSSNVPVAVSVSGVLSGVSLNHIGVGGNNTCAVSVNFAYCWGANNVSQLGNSLATGNSSSPVYTVTFDTFATNAYRFYQNANSITPGAALAATNTPAALQNPNDAFRMRTGVSTLKVDQAVAGYRYSCALSAGLVYCWGYNGEGQLGNSSTATSLNPVQVTATGALSGKVVTSLASTGDSTCAIASNKVYCWGTGTNGQLGNNSTANSSAPVAVTTSGVMNGKDIESITALQGGYCVLSATKEIFCWGTGTNGQLGNNSTTSSNVPVMVTSSGVLSGRTVTAIGGGYYHACAVADGAPYCWGKNDTGQLGNNTTAQSAVPVATITTGVLSGKTSTEITGGDGFSCVIATNLPYCWGTGGNGELGNSATSQSNVPVTVTGSGALSGKTVLSMDSAFHHTCAVASDNAAYCWGLNAAGELGTGNTTAVNQPTAVVSSGYLAGKLVTQVSAVAEHTCAVASGLMACWGENAQGQLGTGSTSTLSSSPVGTAMTAGPILPAGYNNFKLQFAQIRKLPVERKLQALLMSHRLA